MLAIRQDRNSAREEVVPIQRKGFAEIFLRGGNR